MITEEYTMLTDQACERCRCDDIDRFVDITSTPMQRVVRGDPFPAVDVASAVLVCEECAREFGTRVESVPPTEFVASGDRTVGYRLLRDSR